MSPKHRPRASQASAIIVVGLVAALAVVGLLGMSAPASAAVATPPWFGPNSPVTAAPAYSSYQPSMAIDGQGVLYLAFGGWGGSTTQSNIFFTKSLDGGRTWSAPLRVNNDVGGAAQQEPAIFVDHNRAIYIAWSDYRNVVADVVFAKSTDLGVTWAPNFYLNDDTGTRSQSGPDIAVDGSSTVYAVWTDYRDTNTGPDIYATRSSNAGASFSANSRVNNEAGAILQGS